MIAHNLLTASSRVANSLSSSRRTSSKISKCLQEKRKCKRNVNDAF